MLHKRPLMSLKSSLYLGFGFVVLLSILITGIGIQKVGFINDRLIEINRYNAVRVASATDMRGAVQARSIALRELIHVVDSKVHYPLDTLKIEAKNYQAAREKLQENMQDAEHTSDEEKKILAEIDKHALEAMEIIQTTIAERAKGSQEETHPHTHHVVVDRGRVVFDNWAKDIRDFIRYQQSKNQIAVDEVSATSEGFRDLMVLLTAIAVAVSLFIAFWIARYVYKHLGGEPYYAASMVYKIAHGDLTEKIKVVHPKSMLAAVVFMQTNLKKTFQKLLENEQRLSQRTKLVFQSSQAAQRAAENQSEISHETEASIKQISDSIQSISDIAKHTETNSAETSKLSESGSELVRSAAKEVANVTRLVNLSSSQIAELKVSTQEIGGIADVIKEIAEQTNLLALNAAIEAARAGESGQGFGVVADEVRRLADRTSKATAGISQMIDTIQQETLSTVESMADVAPQVEKGLHLANEATAMLVKIYEQAVQSTSYAHEVADAADKQVSQAMSIYQLMEIISQKSSETNQLMTENTEAVHELEDIAKNLLELLKDYKI